MQGLKLARRDFRHSSPQMPQARPPEVHLPRLPLPSGEYPLQADPHTVGDKIHVAVEFLAGGGDAKLHELGDLVPNRGLGIRGQLLFQLLLRCPATEWTGWRTRRWLVVASRLYGPTHYSKAKTSP
jgi:hypothetical protein